jgi:hypothetical protein
MIGLMTIRTFSIIVFIFILGGCIKQKNNVQTEYNGKLLEQLVRETYSGNKTSNETLSGIHDTLLPLPSNFNKIIIDSLTIENNRFYSVLLEFEYPVYNVFAIYDSSFSLKLIDRSLNGYLSILRRVDAKRTFWEVFEDFGSKDIFKLKRYNLYYVGKDTVVKSLRTNFELTTPKEKLIQDIAGFADDVINTKLYLSSNSLLKETWDTFIWDNFNNSYKSQLNIFDSVVTAILAAHKTKLFNPLIIDKISALRSVGVELSADSINAYNNFNNSTDRFTLFLPEGWKALKNVMVTKQLKKGMSGTLFLSSTLGANFSVVKIGENEKAEDYFTIGLSNEVKGNYSVRFSERISTKKNYIQCFEVSCVNLKYLVIFECPILTYLEHKNLYEDIMNSFGVDC